MARRFNLKPAILLIVFVLITWIGAGGISYAVVELTAGGPQGEQGIQGPAGPAGLTGYAATPATADTPCTRAWEAIQKGLLTPGLSSEQLAALVQIAQAFCKQ
jgi:hypothetical protein